MKMKNRVLAVLALALLIINMVPVKRAEAAAQMPDLFSAVWQEGSYSDMVSKGDYVIYLEDGSTLYWVICSSPNQVRSNGVVDCNYYVFGSYSDGVFYCRGRNASSFNAERGNGIIGSNYDFTGDGWSKPHSNMTFSWTVPVIPDAEFDSYDRLGFILQNVDATYLADGIWNITYSPSVTEYYMWYSVRVSIPPAIMVDSWKGKSPDDILSDDVIGEWRKGLSDFYDVTFDVLNVIPADSIQKKTTAGYFSLDIKSLIQERWSDLYPGVDEAMLDFIIAYAFPNVVVTRAFYIDYGSRVFGPANVARMAKFTSRIGGTNQEDILYALGSALEPVSGWLHAVGIQVGNKEEIDLNVALKEEIEQLKIERQSYLEEIAALESQIDNMVNGDSNSIFDTFSNIANGLKSMSGSVRNISIAVGNVFAFFPGEIITILFGGFVACIVIAVYKAIRG